MSPAKLTASLVAACLLLASLPVAAPAAKRLSIRDASARTERIAEELCDRDPDCRGSDAFNCRRLARRRVSCVASIAGTDAGGDYQCDRLVIIRMRSQGGLKHAVGEPRCYQV